MSAADYGTGNGLYGFTSDFPEGTYPAHFGYYNWNINTSQYYQKVQITARQWWLPENQSLYQCAISQIKHSCLNCTGI